MENTPSKAGGRLSRVRNNLRLGLSLAWAASPRLLLRYTLLGMFSAVMPPVTVLLGAMLVDKIADARVHQLNFMDLLYRNADIWILDEPTSALDPEAEAGIFAELKENLKGRIGIVISHRFSTVRIADRIAVIDDGQVKELGSHDELLAAGNRYAELFELQAMGYR